MSIYDGAVWRYKLFVEPFLLTHGSPYDFFKRSMTNQCRSYSKNPCIYISADSTNAGDKASSLGLQQLVGIPGIELFCSKVALGVTQKYLQKLSKNRSQGPRVFIGGGGLLQEAFTPFWNMIVDMDIPFILFGIGTNELIGQRSRTSHELLSKISKKASGIHVRDKRTWEFFQPLIENEKLWLGVCPSVNYILALDSRLKESTSPIKEDYILYAEHAVDLKMSGQNPDEIENWIRTIAKNRGLKFKKVTHIQESIFELLRLYQHSSYVVSSRLHGVIFSFALRKPCIAIRTDLKTEQFIKTFSVTTSILEPGFKYKNLLNSFDHLGTPKEREDSERQAKFLQTLAFNNNITIKEMINKMRLT